MYDWIKGKKILIIGGTGTIGKCLVETLIRFEPSVIRIFSRDEHKQFELKNKWKNIENLRFLIGDVRDKERLGRAMESIDYVFHLAAMKHVEACEYNPFEAVQTNIVGTQNVIQVANQMKVKKVVFTSSDKAISPTNTYGATKLAAERLISAAEYQKGTSQTCFTAVRFGNVMGSRGSVIPLFKERILNGEPLFVTNNDVTRFMMTTQQAVDLLLQATDRSVGGEVFVLKMPVIRLGNLTSAIVQSMQDKYKLAHEVEINEIGLKPGEKLYEELMTFEESRHAIELPDMFIVPSPFLEQSRDYGGKPAKRSTYSSEHVHPLNTNEIIDL
ncbi:SDR family NAD(P)-dependent oxidoreductase, partial [Mesorhizobium sp. M00.F.Ca.ET.186.01.1.1]